MITSPNQSRLYTVTITIELPAGARVSAGLRHEFSEVEKRIDRITVGPHNAAAVAAAMKGVADAARLSSPKSAEGRAAANGNGFRH